MDVELSAQPNSAIISNANESSLARSYAFCQRVACREAGNFYWSFRLLPADRRKAMCALYAFMRQTDDIADTPTPGVNRATALDQWQFALNQQLAGLTDGTFAWEGFPALACRLGRGPLLPAYLGF